ncbi:UNVERIFIED_CONTAM: hypothetical protein Sradi_1436000 [Sesamum radiatum]|uniref:Uncharacterized protein n=1 Tax=Sesamum radiatum TaxID=300843 RepID=A0AAW2U6B0_SESRA
MADMRGSGVVCDDRCGCPSPCPGGIACAQQGAGMIRQRSTSSAPAGNTAAATPAPVPSPRSGGLARPFAGVVLAAPAQHALLETLPTFFHHANTSLSYEYDQYSYPMHFVCVFVVPWAFTMFTGYVE